MPDWRTKPAALINVRYGGIEDLAMCLLEHNYRVLARDAMQGIISSDLLFVTEPEFGPNGFHYLVLEQGGKRFRGLYGLGENTKSPMFKQDLSLMVINACDTRLVQYGLRFGSTLVVDPQDYSLIMKATSSGGISDELRTALNNKALDYAYSSLFDLFI